MQSPSNPQDVDPKEIGIVPEHEELVGYVYKRVVREVLARIDQRLAELEKHAPSDAGEGQGAARSRDGFIDRLWLSRWAVPGSIGLVLTAALIGGALAWRSLDADPAKSLVARLTPQFMQNLFSAKDSQDAAQEPAATPGAPQATADGAAAPAAASDAPAAQAPSSAQQAAAAQPQSTSDNGGHDDETRGMAAASSQDLAPLIQKLSHDIVNLGQGIDQLRHGQEQMSHDNAMAIQQLQVGQDQLVRIMSKQPAAQNAQAKPTTPPPQRATTAARPRRPPAQQQPSLLFRRAT